MEYSKWLLTGLLFSLLISWSIQISLLQKNHWRNFPLHEIAQELKKYAQGYNGTALSGGPAGFPGYPVP